VFGLANGFINHLYTSLGTASNYGAIPRLHNSQHPLSLLPAVPWQRLLTVDILPLPALMFFLRGLSFRTACQLFPQLNWIAICSQPPLQSLTALSAQLSLSIIFNCRFSTDSLYPVAFPITTLHGPNRKHRFQQFLNCSLRIIRCRGAPLIQHSGVMSQYCNDYRFVEEVLSPLRLDLRSLFTFVHYHCSLTAVAPSFDFRTLH
jgi:hypothetical protein